jgi:hypothetical protein
MLFLFYSIFKAKEPRHWTTWVKSQTVIACGADDFRHQSDDNVAVSSRRSIGGGRYQVFFVRVLKWMPDPCSKDIVGGTCYRG